ncbi:hypothetical protein GFPCMMHI_01152 [Ensifer adhaerens]|nr:hypothetical protein [Ensifer adhaerens]
MDDFRVVHSSVAGTSETCGLIVSVPFGAAVYHSLKQSWLWQSNAAFPDFIGVAIGNKFPLVNQCRYPSD